MARLNSETGKVSRPGKMGKWRPKQWRPEYDRIVAYSAMGKSNVWIAETLHFTPEHISTILNLPQAQELSAVLHKKLRENIVVNIPAVLDEIAQQTVKRLKTMMFDDELFDKSPFAVIDRGMDVLKGLSHLKTGAPVPAAGNTTNIGTVVIAPAHRTDILEGLDKLKQIAEIHGSPAAASSTTEEREG